MQVVAQNRLQRQFGCQRPARLHLDEDRGFLQPAAQPDGDQAEDAAEEERDTPGAGLNRLRREDRVDHGGDQRAEQDAERQAGSQKAARKAHVSQGYVLSDEGPGARNLAADGGTLQDAHQHEQDRSEHADRGIGRQDRHAQCGEHHQQDREGEDTLAAEQVTEVGEQDAAERADQIAGSEDAEGLDQHQPVRHVRREEQLADDGGKEDEDDEIVKFQRAAECGEAERAEILRGEAARYGGGSGRHGVTSRCEWCPCLLARWRPHFKHFLARCVRPQFLRRPTRGFFRN